MEKFQFKILEIRTRFNYYNEIINRQKEAGTVSKTDMIAALHELSVMVDVQKKIVDELFD